MISNIAGVFLETNQFSSGDKILLSPQYFKGRVYEFMSLARFITYPNLRVLLENFKFNCRIKYDFEHKTQSSEFQLRIWFWTNSAISVSALFPPLDTIPLCTYWKLSHCVSKKVGEHLWLIIRVDKLVIF